MRNGLPDYARQRGRVMNKSREQFEAWWEKEWCGESPMDGWTSLRESDGYIDEDINAQWEAWQASRAAIEIDTGYLLGDGDNDTEWTEGYNDGIQRADRAIRAAGLKVKGDDSGETDLSHQR